MMYRILIATIMMGFLLVNYTAASGQLYRYRDASGNWFYTDNLADVPDSQREDCKKYDSIASPAGQPTDSSQKSSGKQAAASGNEADQMRAELKARKTGLDQEYDALVAESEALEEMSLNLQGAADKKDFENRRDKFNRRVKSFEKKRQAFTLDLQAYNSIAEGPKN